MSLREHHRYERALSQAIDPDKLLAAWGNPEQALLDIQRLIFEEDLYLFLKEAWRNIDPSSFVSGWHLEAIAEHLEAVTHGGIRRLIINIPPRCSKSSLVSVAWPAWTWAQRAKPGLPLSGAQVQFLFASYAQSLSMRDSLKTRRLIESPWYQSLWGHAFQLTGDQNAKQRFENTRGGYRLATSVDGALTGEGGAIIGVDDPHNTREIESDAVRKATLTWWDEAMSTRLNDPKTGAYVVIMQRLYEDDLTGHILSKEHQDWVHLCLPMRYEPLRHCSTMLGWNDPRNDDGELLWPDRFGEPEVRQLEQALGTFAASGQLQQAPSPRGGGIFKRDFWQLWPPEGEKFDDTGRPLGKLTYPKMDFVVASVDTALTEKEENDPSACTIWGVFTDSRRQPKAMLMDAWCERLQFNALVERVIETCRKWRIDRLLIEAKANGLSVAQEIVRLCGGEGWGTTPVGVKGDKVARAYSVQHLYEAKLIFAPERRWSQLVIDNMAVFPKGKHDDLTDSAVQALRYLRGIGALKLVEEHESDLRKDLAPKGPAKLPYDV